MIEYGILTSKGFYGIMARKLKEKKSSIADRWNRPYFIKDRNDLSLWHIQVTIAERYAICGAEEINSSEVVPVIDLKEYVKVRNTCKKCIKGFKKLLRKKKGE